SETSTETVSPGLSIEKNGTLADLDGDALAGLGEVIGYTFTVTNTGNTRLVDVHVVDDFVAEISPSSITLEPGASFTFTAAAAVTEADILSGEIVNIASAAGTVPDGDDVESDTDTWSILTAPIAES